MQHLATWTLLALVVWVSYVVTSVPAGTTAPHSEIRVPVIAANPTAAKKKKKPASATATAKAKVEVEAHAEDARKDDILTDPMDGNPSESWTSQFARF